MRKGLVYFLIGLCTVCMLGCTKQGKTESTGKESDVQEEQLVYKELTDPRGKTVDNTSDGKPKPQIVSTTYETKDVVVADYIPTEMGYAVDPTGMTDSTAGLQKALNDCFSSGGGTVYLPEGNYAISDTVYIPPYVTLRGDWQDPDAGTKYGTIISVWMEPEDSHSAGAFKLGGSSGAVGLTIYYPLQSLDLIKPYPYTFYVDGSGANHMLFTVRNVTVINGYRGIGTSRTNPHECLHIENFKGTFLDHSVYLANSADVGTVENFSISTKYWREASADCMNAAPGRKLEEFTKRYATGMIIADIEWTEFNKISIEDCSIGLRVVDGERIAFGGSFYEMTVKNCEQGLVFDDLDEEWGAIFSRAQIEGGIVNHTNGKVKLCDVTVEGEIVEDHKGSVMFDEGDLDKFNIDYERTYVKPKENIMVANIAESLFTDAAPELQGYIDKMAEQGGGIVYIPGGTYRFLSPITVPAGVELRGCSTVPTRNQAAVSTGTVFYCYYGDDDSNGVEDQAFITLKGENAGINGIRIIYPENGPASENLNTTYTIRGEAKGVYAVNLAIVASAYGIDFRNCDEHYIDGITTCCYYNVFRLGGNGGFVTRNLQNGTVLGRTRTEGLKDWATTTAETTAMHTTITRKECEQIIVDNAKNQVIYNTFAYGVKAGVIANNCENTLVVNIGNDRHYDDGAQVYVNGGSFTGINFLRAYGYSYDFTEGKIALYNRIARREVGETTIEKSN